jgi:hypothetical protein
LTGLLRAKFALADSNAIPLCIPYRFVEFAILFSVMNRETTALVACVVATYCSERSRADLLAIAYPKYEGRLAIVAKEIGIDSLDWRRTLPRPIVCVIFRSLDALVTGGKNYGAI